MEVTNVDTQAKATHTPGPWWLESCVGDDYVIIAEGHVPGSPGMIRLVNIPDAKLSPEYQANAHLIAAAPEMLEALRAAASRMVPSVDCGTEGEVAAEMVRAAIAKAEGRS